MNYFMSPVFSFLPLQVLPRPEFIHSYQPASAEDKIDVIEALGHARVAHTPGLKQVYVSSSENLYLC